MESVAVQWSGKRRRTERLTLVAWHANCNRAGDVMCEWEVSLGRVRECADVGVARGDTEKAKETATGIRSPSAARRRPLIGDEAIECLRLCECVCVLKLSELKRPFRSLDCVFAIYIYGNFARRIAAGWLAGGCL